MWNEWSLTEQVLLCVVAAMWLYQMYFYLRYILAAVRCTRPTPPATNAGTEEQTAPAEQLGVSVIVCAKNEEQNLRDYLQALFTQDYPEYEVIVVNDGSVDNTRTFLEYWQKRYRNLRLTFVPIEAQVTSTKKLAITLGAKAAQYDYLLLTDADCRPESPHWISEMMKGFARPSGSEAVSIVLGFGAYFVKPGLLNRLIQFDTLLNGLQYLGMAVCGHPYMGVGRNLAYRKQLFFAHGGFYGLLNNKAGDDDLFVNREATATNTAVVCTPDSLTWSVPKNSLSDWLHQKRRHLSVAPKYKFATKLRLGLEPLTRGLLYAAVIALVVVCGYRLSVTGYRSAISMWLPAIIAMSAMLLRWLMQSILLNIPARRWGVTRTVLLIPLWEIVLPLITLTLMLIEPLRPKPKRW